MVEIMFYDAAKDEGLAKDEGVCLKKLKKVFSCHPADTELPDINENVADIRSFSRRRQK